MVIKCKSYHFECKSHITFTSPALVYSHKHEFTLAVWMWTWLIRNTTGAGYFAVPQQAHMILRAVIPWYPYIFLVLSKIHYDSCSIFRWNGLMIMLHCICLGLGSLAMSWLLRVKSVSECTFRELFSQFPMCWGLHQQHIQPQEESWRHLERLWTIGYLVNLLVLSEAILYSELWYEYMHSVFDFSYITHLFNTTIFICNPLITLLTKCPLCP